MPRHSVDNGLQESFRLAQDQAGLAPKRTVDVRCILDQRHWTRFGEPIEIHIRPHVKQLLLRYHVRQLELPRKADQLRHSKEYRCEIAELPEGWILARYDFHDF